MAQRPLSELLSLNLNYHTDADIKAAVVTADQARLTADQQAASDAMGKAGDSDNLVGAQLNPAGSNPLEVITPDGFVWVGRGGTRFDRFKPAPAEGLTYEDGQDAGSSPTPSPSPSPSPAPESGDGGSSPLPAQPAGPTPAPPTSPGQS